MSTSSFSDREISVQTSFREKTAWASLLTTVVIYSPYFVYVFGQIAHGTPAIVSIAGAFLLVLILQTVLMIVAHLVFALHGKPPGKDERDLSIEARSFRYAYITFAAGTWMAVGGTLSWAGVQSTNPGSSHTPLLMLQTLLLAFVVAETTKFLVQIISYRRGY